MLHLFSCPITKRKARYLATVRKKVGERRSVRKTNRKNTLFCALRNTEHFEHSFIVVQRKGMWFPLKKEETVRGSFWTES